MTSSAATTACGAGRSTSSPATVKRSFFAEVKTRSSHRFGEAREAVDAKKQARIAAAAQRYLMQYAHMDAFCRFDVLEVDASRPLTEIRHWENAFIAG